MLWKLCYTLYSESSLNSAIKSELLQILANLCLGQQFFLKRNNHWFAFLFHDTWVSTSFCAFTSSMTPLNDSTLTYREKWSLLYFYSCVTIPCCGLGVHNYKTFESSRNVFPVYYANNTDGVIFHFLYFTKPTLCIDMPELCLRSPI